MSFHFSTKSAERSMFLCQSCKNLGSRCGRNPFQQLATSYSRLPGLRRCSPIAGLSCDLSRLQTGVGLRGPSPDCVVGAGALPIRFLRLSPMSNVQCEVVSTLVTMLNIQATCRSDCDGTSMRVFSCLSVSKQLSAPVRHGALRQAALRFPCHPSVLFDKCVNFLLVAFRCGAA